jgi:hypothetical protein
MKRFAYIPVCLIALALLSIPGAFAQEVPDHVNVGVFGNYVRLNDGGLNLAGGGRVFRSTCCRSYSSKRNRPMTSTRRLRKVSPIRGRAAFPSVEPMCGRSMACSGRS